MRSPVTIELSPSQVSHAEWAIGGMEGFVESEDRTFGEADLPASMLTATRDITGRLGAVWVGDDCVVIPHAHTKDRRSAAAAVQPPGARSAQHDGVPAGYLRARVPEVPPQGHLRRAAHLLRQESRGPGSIARGPGSMGHRYPPETVGRALGRLVLRPP